MKYTVYVKVDVNNTITAVNSDAFLLDVDGWTKIDRGVGDRYHHAQAHYLPLGLTDDNGVYNYKLVDGEVVERTADDKQADVLQVTMDVAVARIKCELNRIDSERIRPLAAIATGTATDYDTKKLKQLEQEAQNLRAELAELNTVVIEDEQTSETGSTAIPE